MEYCIYKLGFLNAVSIGFDLVERECIEKKTPTIKASRGPEEEHPFHRFQLCAKLNYDLSALSQLLFQPRSHLACSKTRRVLAGLRP